MIKNLQVNEIVQTVSETHLFDSDFLFAVNTSDVEDGKILNPPFLPLEELKGQFKKTIKNGDILFSEIRPANRHFAVVDVDNPKQYVVSTKLMVLRKFNDEVDSEYFYYWLTNTPFLNILQRRAENRICSFPQITFELLSEYSVPVPDIDTQKQIAKILKIIDSKISLNNRINAELEGMAKTIYDYWFVQFDYPDENGKPYRTSGGVMEWNEQLKREIPRGWMVVELSSIEDNIVTGKTPATSNEEFYNGQIPFVTIGDIRGNTFIVKTEQSLSEAGANSQKNKYIPENVLCVTCIATPGLIGFTTQLSQTNQQINSIVCQNAENRIYLYFALNDYFKYSFGAKIGATFANMNKDDFSTIKMIQPLRQVKIEFYKATKTIFEKMKQCSNENLELTALRDWLLPMLMNGQATVE